MSTSPTSASLIQLVCFVRVVDAGSFAEAGRRLRMTTSGVSKAISRLEAEHGVRLLHRSTHAMSLTDEGEQLLEECRDLLRGYDRVQTALAAGADGAGRVRISAAPGFARKWLLPVLSGLLEEHPEIKLDIRSSYALADIADEGIDLALRTGAMDGLPGLFSQRLLSSPWCVYAAPDYVARHGAPLHPSDLAQHRLLGFSANRNGRASPWQFRRFAGDEGGGQGSIVVNAPIVFDDGCAAYEMALAGCGLAWAPEWLATEDLQRGCVVEVLRSWRSDEQIVSIVRRDRRLTSRRLSIVLEALQEAAERWQSRRTLAV